MPECLSMIKMKRKTLLSKTLALIFILIMLSTMAYANTVTRSFSKACQNRDVTVTLTISKDADRTVYGVTERIRNDMGFELIDDGGAIVTSDDTYTALAFAGVGVACTTCIEQYTLSFPATDNKTGFDGTFSISGNPQVSGSVTVPAWVYVRPITCNKGDIYWNYEEGAEWDDDADNDDYGYGCSCSGNDCNAAQNHDDNAQINPSIQEGYVGREDLLCNGVDDNCDGSDCCAPNYQCTSWKYYDTYCTNRLETQAGERSAGNELQAMINAWLNGDNGCGPMTMANLFGGFANT